VLIWQHFVIYINVDARMFIEGEELSETGSVASGQTMTANLRPFVTGIEKSMYYM
jgi:hypothetical protein